jgi:hypothetical protein
MGLAARRDDEHVLATAEIRDELLCLSLAIGEVFAGRDVTESEGIAAGALRFV